MGSCWRKQQGLSAAEEREDTADPNSVSVSAASGERSRKSVSFSPGGVLLFPPAASAQHRQHTHKQQGHQQQKSKGDVAVSSGSNKGARRGAKQGSRAAHRGDDSSSMGEEPGVAVVSHQDRARSPQAAAVPVKQLSVAEIAAQVANR